MQEPIQNQQPTPPAQPEVQLPTPVQTQPKPKTKSKLPLILIALAITAIIFAALGAGAFYILSKDDDNELIDPDIVTKTCEYNSVTYNEGDSFTSDDGCNTCSCGDGQVVCTEMACNVNPTIIETSTNWSTYINESLRVSFKSPPNWEVTQKVVVGYTTCGPHEPEDITTSYISNSITINDNNHLIVDIFFDSPPYGSPSRCSFYGQEESIGLKAGDILPCEYKYIQTVNGTKYSLTYDPNDSSEGFTKEITLGQDSKFYNAPCSSGAYIQLISEIATTQEEFDNIILLAESLKTI